MASTFAALQHGDYRTLWLTTLFSNLGAMVQAVAAGWMMTTLTDSAEMVALVQAATSLPMMLFSLGSGALADSFDRRLLMIWAQSIMFAAAVLLGVLAFAGLVTPWLLLGFTFVIGTGSALHHPSWQASIGDLLPREHIPGAVTLNSMSFNSMRSIGPGIGGLIVAFAGTTAAFVFNAFTYIPLIASLFRWKPNVPARTLPRESFLSAISAGVRYASMSPNLTTVLFRGAIFSVAVVSVQALMPVMASTALGGGPLTLGAMLAAFGTGGIIGGIINARMRTLFSNETLVRLSCVAFAGCAATLGMSTNLWLSLLVMVPAGIFWVITLSMFNVIMQLSTPRWVVGRALSIYQTATFGGMAFGAWVWGAVTDAYGAAIALGGAAALLLVCAVIGFYRRVPDFSSLDLSPLDQFREPALRLDLKARSGPIMVLIDYEIDHDDVPAFLEAMTQRRRIRIRDGARQWALLRDLENPRLWTESYHVPTWVEYIRHNQRRTRADAENNDALRKLHAGAEPPRVHRMIERQTVPPKDDMPLKPHSDIH